MNKLIIIGIILIVIGILAGIYTTTQTHIFGITSTAIPYAAYAIPLYVGGIVLIIVGALQHRKN
jgi:uncharacterized membrane protein YdcZ (DUF606 family)